MSVNYAEVYSKDYFSGKKSFFWKGGYGGYGILSQLYFNNLFAPIKPYLITKYTATVLDIGCAYGFMLERFPKNYRKFGVDVSKHAIAIAQKRLPAGVFKTAGVEKKTPFNKDYFDLVICNDVLEHLESPAKALGHIFTSLKKNGIFYLTTPNYNWVRKVFFAYPDKTEHHISLLPHQELADLLTQTGFKMIDHWTFTHLLPKTKLPLAFGIESAFIVKK